MVSFAILFLLDVYNDWVILGRRGRGDCRVITYIIGVLLEDPVPGGLGARDLA